MDCHIHSNWGIESIAQQIEAATKGERDQKTSSSRSLVDLQTAFPLAEAASEALLAASRELYLPPKLPRPSS